MHGETGERIIPSPSDAVYGKRRGKLSGGMHARAHILQLLINEKVLRFKRGVVCGTMVSVLDLSGAQEIIRCQIFCSFLM